MARVRALDANNDWTFGSGKANYISGKDAINQTVATRLKSFKYDNPLDTEANIDWIGLLGTKGTQDDILNEIERVVLATDGVTNMTNLEVTLTNNRAQSISVSYNTIYDDETVTIDDILGVDEITTEQTNVVSALKHTEEWVEAGINYSEAFEV